MSPWHVGGQALVTSSRARMKDPHILSCYIQHPFHPLQAVLTGSTSPSSPCTSTWSAFSQLRDPVRPRELSPDKMISLTSTWKQRAEALPHTAE